MGAGVPELPCSWRPWISLRSGAIRCVGILGGGETTVYGQSFPAGTLVWISSVPAPSTFREVWERSWWWDSITWDNIAKAERKSVIFCSQISRLVPLRVAAAMAFTTKNGYAQAYRSIHQSYDLHHHIHAFKPTCQEEKARVNCHQLFPGTAISHCKCRTVPGTTTTVVPVSKVSFCTNFRVSG